MSHVGFIAHRGDRRRYPENTPAAFRSVLDRPSADGRITGIELDIQLTADGRVVVFHDGNLKSLCERDVTIARTTYAETSALAESSGHLAGQPIPLLEDVLEAVGHRTTLLIEIKAYDYDLAALADRVADLLQAYQPRGDIILHSFATEALERIIPVTSRLDVAYGLLLSTIESLEGAPAELMARMNYLHPSWRLLIDHPARLASHGLPLNTWTVNSLDTMRQLVSMADRVNLVGIMTDDLDLIDQL